MNAGHARASAAPLVGYGDGAVKFGKWGDKSLDFFKGLFGKGEKSSCTVPNSFTPERRLPWGISGRCNAGSAAPRSSRPLPSRPPSSC